MNYHLIPNWSDPVTETYAFRTTVFTSRSGKEQRMAERLLPRRTVKFATLLWGSGLTDFHALLHDRGAGTITIPDPARFAAVLERDAPAGTSELYITSVPPWLKPGMALSLSDLDYTEFRGGSTITTIGSFSIDYDSSDFDVRRRARVLLTAPLTRRWPKGSAVRPVIEGRLPTEVTLDYRNDSIAESDLTLDVLTGSQTPDLGDVTFETFNGRPVLLIAPNWVQPPNVTITTPFETVDFERGITKTYLPIEFYTRIMQFNYLGRSRDSMATLLELFVRMRGRQGEFYCPSWLSDMVPVGGIAADSSVMTVAGSAAATAFADSTVNKAVAIRLNDGRWVFRQVASIAVTNEAGPGAFNQDYNADFDTGGQPGQFSVLTFTQPIAEDIYREQITMVCWFNVFRFASDTLTIRWSTDDVAQVVTQVMTLESLSPEA